MKQILYLSIFFNLLYSNDILNYLNFLRQKSGASSFKFNYILKQTAFAHAKYLAINNEITHYENPNKKAFFALYPWDRIIKAGYKTRVVVENISFYETNFKSSINKLMGTIYHRLALLDFRVDSIGFAKYKNRYVYVASNSKINNLCKKKSLQNYYGVEGLCKNKNKVLEQFSYNKAINSTLKNSKKVSFYPYDNQKNVPLKLFLERPRFLYGNNYGFGVTARFNPYYIKKVSLISFKLFKNHKKIKSKIVTFSNDIQNKLDKFTFVLIPLSPLEEKSNYKAILKVKENGKIKIYKWNFNTI